MAVKLIIYILNVFFIGFCMASAKSEYKYNFYFYDGANNLPTGKEGIYIGEGVSETITEKSKDTKDYEKTNECPILNKIIKENIEQLNDNIIKRLNEIEESLTRKIETEIKLLFSNEETKKINDNSTQKEQNAEATKNIQCEKERDEENVLEELPLTTEKDMYESTTDASENKLATGKDINKSTTKKDIAKVDDGVEILIETKEINVLKPNIVSSDWLREFCTDEEDKIKYMEVGNFSQELDILDHSMQQRTGCQQMVAAPWLSNNSFAYNPTKSKVYEQRLALRTVGQGRTDIYITSGGVFKYYFAFSNTSNTLEFNHRTPYKQFWMANLKPEANMVTPGQEHYLPLYFKIEQNRVTFSVGCMRATRSVEIDLKTADNITLTMVTSAYPAKLLFNCPMLPSQ